MTKAAHPLSASLSSLLVVPFLFAFASVTQAGTVYSIDLTGAQEVPPNASINTGTATFELSDDESTLSYSIEVHKFDLGDVLTPESDDNIVGLHLHNAAPDANGPIVFGIYNPSHDASRVITTMTDGTIRFAGAWDASDTDAANLADQLGNLKNGQLYVNLHTNAFSGGEIRGQIVPEPTGSLLATIALAGSLVSLRRRR